MLFFICVSFTYFHHGWANYDQKKVRDFKTVIEEAVFENPHVLVKAKYQSKIFTIYLAPTSRMADRGLTKAMIEKGKAVRIVAYPHRNVKNEMRAERIYVDGEKYELR